MLLERETDWSTALARFARAQAAYEQLAKARAAWFGKALFARRNPDGE